MNASGLAIAVWIKSNGLFPNPPPILQAAFYSSQTTQWTAPQPVPTASFGSVLGVGIDAGGNAIVVNGIGLYYGVRYSAATSTWGAPVILPFGSTSSPPVVHTTFSSNGDAVATFNGASASGIAAMRYDAASNAWQPTPGLATNSANSFAAMLSVASNAAGQVLAVWLRVTGGVYTVESRLFTNGAWAPVVIGPTVTPRGAQGRVGLGDGVGLLVAYESSTRMVQSARFDVSSNTWSALTDVGSAGAGRSTTGASTLVPMSIAITPTGNAVALWDTLMSGVTSVTAANYAAGSGTWGTAIDLASGAVPRVVIAPNGNAVAAWAGSAGVQVARYVAPPVGSPTPVLAPAVVNRPNLTLSWTAPTIGPAPTSYTVVASLTAGGPVVASVPVGTQLSLTGPVPDGTYYVRVIADVSGTAVSSNEIRVDVVAPVVPSAPQSVSAIVSGSVVTFAWQAPATTGGAPITDYLLEAGNAPGLANLGTLPMGNVTSLITPPVPDGSYYVRLRARNAAGLGAASPDVRVVVGPPPPSAPTLTGAGSAGGTVTLSWSVPASGAVPTGYRLQAGSQPGASNIGVLDVPATTVAFTAPGAPSGTYYVRVVALSALGLGDVSNEVTIVVP